MTTFRKNNESIDSESSDNTDNIDNSDLPLCDSNDLAGEGRESTENSLSCIEFPEHSFPKRVLKNNWYQ